MMAGQENLLLNLDGDIGLKAPEGKGHVYELRRYRGTGAGIPTWSKLFKEVLPAREKYSKIVGLWTTEIGKLNLAAHLWAYDDLNHRAKVRSAALADPAWMEFVPKGSACLAEMETTILLPTPISPLQ